MENFDGIHDSPSKIYNDALPLCPSSSWLRKCYAVESSPALTIVRGVPAKWETCFRTVQFNGTPQSLSCRHNTIAVGLNSGNAIILDAITGSQTAVLCGHTKEVTCLTFSLDGKLLVSGGSNKAVSLWDIQTGGIIRSFDDHPDQVTSVSISADCSRIASVSSAMIYLWNVQTGEGVPLSHTEKSLDRKSVV